MELLRQIGLFAIRSFARITNFFEEQQQRIKLAKKNDQDDI